MADTKRENLEVKSALVIAYVGEGDNRSQVYLYQGAGIPKIVEDEEIKRLQDEGFIGPKDADETEQQQAQPSPQAGQRRPGG